jgi:hypothetical protein
MEKAVENSRRPLFRAAAARSYAEQGVRTFRREFSQDRVLWWLSGLVVLGGAATAVSWLHRGVQRAAVVVQGEKEGSGQLLVLAWAQDALADLQQTDRVRLVWRGGAVEVTVTLPPAKCPEDECLALRATGSGARRGAVPIRFAVVPVVSGKLGLGFGTGPASLERTVEALAWHLGRRRARDER